MKAYIVVDVPKEMIDGKYNYTLSLDSKSCSCHNIKGKTELKPLPKDFVEHEPSGRVKVQFGFSNGTWTQTGEPIVE